MGFQLLPGDVCVVQRQVLIDGKLAFNRGDVVRVENIDPDPERPGLKYVVYSEALGTKVRVLGANLERKNCPECGADLVASAMKCSSCGWIIPGQELRAREKEMDRFERHLEDERNISSWDSPW
ncbi:MAG: hypothetical protein ACYC99_05295 [Candidatus Geothermincolia bacterium]